MRSRLFRFAWSRPRHGATRGRASALLGRLALVCMIFGVAASCAEERAPINRVQAMALSKHFFVGANLSDTSDDP